LRLSTKRVLELGFAGHRVDHRVDERADARVRTELPVPVDRHEYAAAWNAAAMPHARHHGAPARGNARELAFAHAA
jgi:hypothetical protein